MTIGLGIAIVGIVLAGAGVIITVLKIKNDPLTENNINNNNPTGNGYLRTKEFNRWQEQFEKRQDDRHKSLEGWIQSLSLDIQRLEDKI